MRNSNQRQTRNRSSGHGRTVYGIDVRDQQVRAVKSRRRGTKIVHTPVQPNEIRQRSSGAKDVFAVALHCRESFVRQLNAPITNRRKAKRILPTLLDLKLPFPIEDCLYRFPVLVASKTGISALAVGVRVQEFDRKIQETTSSLVEPDILDHEALALWSQSFLEAPVQSGEGIRILCHIGKRSAALLIGQQNGRLVAAHGIRNLEAKEINRIVASQLDPAAHDFEWIWSGEISDGSDTLQKVEHAWTENSGTFHVQKIDNPEFFLPRALATRALRAQPLSCNFRTGKYASKKMWQHEKRILRGGCGLLLLASALLLASGIGMERAAQQRLQQHQANLQTSINRLAGFPIAARGIHARKIVEDLVKQRDHDLRPLQQFLAQDQARLLQELMVAAEKQHIHLEQIRLTETESMLSGTGPHWKSAEPLRQLLQAHARPVEIERFPATSEQRIPFRLKGVH